MQNSSGTTPAYKIEHSVKQMWVSKNGDTTQSPQKKSTTTPVQKNLDITQSLPVNRFNVIASTTVDLTFKSVALSVENTSSQHSHVHCTNSDKYTALSSTPCTTSQLPLNASHQLPFPPTNHTQENTTTNISNINEQNPNAHLHSKSLVSPLSDQHVQ